LLSEYSESDTEEVRRVRRPVMTAGMPRPVGGDADESAPDPRVLEALAVISRNLPEAFALVEPVRDAAGTIVDFRFVHSNPSADLRLGRQRPLAGTTIREALNEASATELMLSLSSALETGEPVDTTYYMPVAGDEDYWIRTRVVPAGADMLAVSSEDVTADQVARSALQRSEARFRALVQNSFDLLVVMDERFRPIYVSPSFSTALGYEVDYIVRHNPDLVHPDDFEAVNAAYQRVHAAALGAAEAIRFRVRHADGSWRTLEARLTNLLQDPAVRGIVNNARDVTEELAAFETVRRSEVRFRTMVEHGHDLVALVDLDGRLVYLSESFRAVLGWDVERLIGTDPTPMLHPDDLAIVADAVAALPPDAGSPLRIRAQHADGRWRTLEGLVRNLLDNPTIQATVINVRDVTDETEALEALVVSQQRFQALTERSADLLALYDADLNLLYASPAYRTVLGIDWGSLAAAERGAMIHPDDLEGSHLAPLRRVRQRPGAQEVTRFRVQHADGSWRHLEAVITNQLEVLEVGGIVVNSRDVTDQVAAEDALRLEKDRFHSLIRHSTDVVLVIAPDYRVTYASPSMTRIFGYDLAEVVGAEVTADLIHSDDLELARRATAAALGEPQGEASYECRIRHAEGHLCWVEVDTCNLVDDPSVGGIVVHMRDVTARKNAEQELAHQALHDVLTGLPNRSLLLDRLAQALARSRRSRLETVVLFLDLDRFKLVNDSLGHAEGDQLLRAVAERLTSRIRATDTVARLGGDEFVVLLEEAGDEATALALAHKLLEALQEPFPVGGRDLYVTTSMGLAISGPDATPHSMLRDADAAMYEAKERGRNRLERFDDTVRDRAVHRSRLDHDLHLALERGELRLAYQPAFDVATLRVVGVEALVRWDHPERGEVGPGEFISIAEDNGLIVPIGEWVLDTACAQCAEWARIDRQAAPVVWVNVSARQLAQPGFAETVAATIARHGLDPSLVGLELTESVLIEEAETTGTKLRDIEELGVRLAIDDFGTGYSSLLYLQRFKVDVLKLDRSFVRELGRNLDDHAISSAVIRLGHSLGMEVSAEGVEEAQQLDLLRALGCDVACGYLLARPGPPEDVTARLWTALEERGLPTP
jgi:diguanylate cyclase (GGDEF)-like protein/PAS domain S-box-containing protein